MRIRRCFVLRSIIHAASFLRGRILRSAWSAACSRSSANLRSSFAMSGARRARSRREAAASRRNVGRFSCMVPVKTGHAGRSKLMISDTRSATVPHSLVPQIRLQAPAVSELPSRLSLLVLGDDSVPPAGGASVTHSRLPHTTVTIGCEGYDPCGDSMARDFRAHCRDRFWAVKRGG